MLQIVCKEDVSATANADLALYGIAALKGIFQAIQEFGHSLPPGGQWQSFRIGSWGSLGNRWLSGLTVRLLSVKWVLIRATRA